MLAQAKHLVNGATIVRAGAVDAIGAVELLDGTVLADARGMFVRMPDSLADATVDQYPEFVNYWQS